jgi:iron complex transport system substrate-binding protein
LPELFNEILGREVRVPEHPKRIVSFSPAATETLFDLGLGGSVVGVSAFCARPPEARDKRRVGSYNTVRPELLDELSPDLIFAVTGYQRDFAVKLSSRYAVYPLELPVSVAGIVDLVVKVGLVTGEAEAGRELAGKLLREIGGLRRAKELNVYVELDLGGPVTFGAHSYITDAIRLLGSSSIFEGVRSEWLEPDFAEVSLREPDVIIYEAKMFSTFSNEDLDRLLSSRKWEGLKAVKSDCCFLTPGPLDFLAHHGPSFITEAMPWLEKTLGVAAERQGK